MARPMGSGAISYCRQGLPSGAPCYGVRLWITFQHGAGATQEVSRERVTFTTQAAVAIGQELTGQLVFPPDSTHSNEFIYVAEVTAVQRIDRPKKCFRVTAAFKRMGVL
jgi:hypothetical protein